MLEKTENSNQTMVFIKVKQCKDTHVSVLFKEDIKVSEIFKGRFRKDTRVSVGSPTFGSGPNHRKHSNFLNKPRR